MTNDDRKTSAPPVVTVAAAETAAATDLLAPVQATSTAVAEPERLMEGLRYLQQRIPGFTQLTWQEKRSHARAASLDPEIIESGLHAAAGWRDTKRVIGRSAEELREEREEIRRWDATIVEMRALTDGMDAANLKRKHHLGSAILNIYRMLGICLQDPHPDDVYLRPYYENMKRAFLRTKQFRRKKKKAAEAEPATE